MHVHSLYMRMTDRISLFGISLMCLLIVYLVSRSVSQPLRQSEESPGIVCQSMVTSY